MLLFLNSSLFGQEVIKSALPVVLPAISGGSKVIASGQSLTVTSGQSVTLSPGFQALSGSNVLIQIGSGNMYPVPPLVSNSNTELNWVISRSFDANGNIIGESKDFFDLGGKMLQSQTKSFTTKHVLASQPIYDKFGRPAIQTLAAPINSSEFFYKSDFVTDASGKAYSISNFDSDASKLNNPDPVNQSVEGTLGWYYGNNNSWDGYVPATSFPYNRTDFLNDGTDEASRNAGVGEQLRMGSGHETYSGTFPVQQQLSNYLAIRNLFFNTAEMGSVGQADMIGAAVESVGKDQQGKWGVTIVDKDGKALMSAIPGNWLTVTNTIKLTEYKEEFVINGNTGDYVKGINVIGAGKLKVFDNNALIYNGGASGFIPPTSLNSSHIYTLRSNQPLTVSYSAVYADGHTDAVCEGCHSEIKSGNLIGQDFYYFNLAQGGNINISGGTVKLTNLVKNTVETNYTALPAGMYKVVAVSGEPQISYTSGYSDVSYNFYNQKGELVATIAPNGVQKIIANGLASYSSKEQLPFINLYEYDKQSRLIASTSTDAGRLEVIYRKDGNVRFSQNAEQRKTGAFSYANYDDIGRAVEKGEYVPGDISFAAAKTSTVLQENISSDGGLTGGVKRDWVKIHYDLGDAAHGMTSYKQDFIEGAISWTENENNKTWYSYDEEGKVIWIIKKLTGLGVKTIDYSYDFIGNITSVAYQKGVASESFYHYYEYDFDQRLVNVLTSLDGVSKLPQANYQYYLHGPLKRIELADHLQGIDYTYTAQGMLKAINHPDVSKDPGKDGAQNGFAPDAFGMTLEYFNGDYLRTGTGISSLATNASQMFYNGNVTGQSWRSTKPASISGTYGTAVNSPQMFTYEYTDKYQFSNNKFGTPNFTSNSFTETVGANREYGLGYDPNGNIQGLNRTNAQGSSIAGFSYSYQNNTNKLKSVNNFAEYSYNSTGEMVGQKRNNGQKYYLKYNSDGMVTSIYSDTALTQLRVSFFYDENGLRIKKVDHLLGINTYYLNDNGGNILAIYDDNGTTLQEKEVPVYAAIRLGMFTRMSNKYTYELTDNQGNVRVVLNKVKGSDGQADVISYSDYYPFGSALTLQGNQDYRFGYQGQYAEADKETGWNNFDLRMYDPAIGRWMGVDPKGQYYSPYVGMGNDPVNRTDPDGGFDEYKKNSDGVYVKVGVGGGAGHDYYDQGNGTSIVTNNLYFDDGSKFQVFDHIEQNFTSTPWMGFASSQLGQTEYSPEDNPAIIGYHATTGRFKTDEIPWCSSFVNWAISQAGIKGTNSASASSWSRWGKKLNKPAYGSVASIDFGGGIHHVGFVAGINSSGRIILLGGNQNDMVKYSSYSTKRIVAYSYPNEFNPSYNLPLLNISANSSFKTTR